MNFNKINNIIGWVICLIACTVYIMTAEAGGSLWDCGEFVSSCFKLQIPHPPGAPLFVLMGRFFIVLFGDNPLTAAKAVNIMNALASGFTILFLFWTITHFARKIIIKYSKELGGKEILIIMAAGAVGALAYTFSDSFWYSAVEGEVYAMSSLFTAVVFWAMLKWEHAVERNEYLRSLGQPAIQPDRWLVFIFFMMGLSIGVHLLNLLCIPAIVMIYYFKKFKATKWGTFWAFIIGCIITGFVQKVVIQYSVDGAGYMDIFTVNALSLPFFSGFTLYFLLLGIMIVFGLKFKPEKFNRHLFIIWFCLIALIMLFPLIIQMVGSGSKILGLMVIIAVGALAGYYIKPKGLKMLRLALWSFLFMLLGYSSYLTTMIRSNANPSVDMYNVDNPMSLFGYLGREQYGDFPLIYGQKFTAQPTNYEKTYTKYQKGKDKYIEVGKEGHYTYDDKDMMLFPRVWDASNDQGHADYYANFLGIEKNADGSYDRDPDFLDNIKFFIGYQNYFMYLRYLMWNFSGKQNDIQGSGLGNPRDGNWITGISFIDNFIYGDQSMLPDSIKNNKAHNKLFLLPFLLGIIGLIFQYKRDKKGILVTFLLFFFTGFAIVIYSNQAGNQPRERDYAYVGSFYVFAIWIGLGVIQVRDWLGRKISSMNAGIIAALICLIAVPTLMAQQEWDDHDRSKKTLARDLARNYLESCAPNAILFSFGDNDTYPLWYAQEVEHIRPDVRVINYSLLGIDWYINQLRYKVNESDPIDVIFTPAQIEGRKRDYLRYLQNGDQSQYRNLDDVLTNWIGSDDPNKLMAQSEEDSINTFPTKRFSIPVDISVVKLNGTVGSNDTAIVPSINFEVQRNIIMKNDLAVLAVIAANHWKRPIYFTNPSVEGLGFDQYLRRDGMTYRLVPINNGQERVNTDWMLDKVMNKFSSGNANVPGVYFDEENRRHLNAIRQACADLALDLANHNRKEDGRKVLNKVDKLMLESNMPYGLVGRYNMQNRTSIMLLEAAYRNEDNIMIEKISRSVKKDLSQQMNYYASLGDMNRQDLDAIMNRYVQMSYTARNNQERGAAEQYFQGNLQKKQIGMAYEIQQTFGLLQALNNMETIYKKASAKETNQPLNVDSINK